MSNLFDNITRIVGSPLPRREATKLLVGGITGSLILPSWVLGQPSISTPAFACAAGNCAAGGDPCGNQAGVPCCCNPATERCGNAILSLCTTKGICAFEGGQYNPPGRSTPDCGPGRECCINPTATPSPAMCCPASHVCCNFGTPNATCCIVDKTGANGGKCCDEAGCHNCKKNECCQQRADGRGWKCVARAPKGGALQINPGQKPGRPFQAAELTVTVAAPGLASIALTKATNLQIEIPKGSGNFFAKGATFMPATPTTDPVTLRADRIDMTSGGSLLVRVCDENGCCEDMDPVVSTLEAEIPQAFSLQQNYPNPFNADTTIRFAVLEAVHVRLTVHDLAGREVVKLIDEEMAEGTYSTLWDGATETGVALASGTYLYRLTAGAYTETKTMTLLR